MSEDFQRLPKTIEEDTKIFGSYTNEFENNLRDKLNISEIINILTGKGMENSPLHSRPQTLCFLDRFCFSLSIMRKREELWGQE